MLRSDVNHKGLFGKMADDFLEDFWPEGVIHEDAKRLTGLAAMLLMMNLKVGRCAACLASPAIPLQHFFTKLLVRFGIQPQAWLLWSNPIHDAF